MAEGQASGRQRILEAAMAAIEAEGGAGLRILEIAAEADITRGPISRRQRGPAR
jgi:AcrR family transcriptional regulator